MNLVWKLLRQHVSVPQFIGFFFANLCGMLIVLLDFSSIAMYCPCSPKATRSWVPNISL